MCDCIQCGQNVDNAIKSVMDACEPIKMEWFISDYEHNDVFMVHYDNKYTYIVKMDELLGEITIFELNMVVHVGIGQQTHETIANALEMVKKGIS